MPWLKIRHCVLAFAFGIAPLIPVAPAQAAAVAPLSASPASLGPSALEAAALANEAGPPVMAQASAYEASAPVRTYATAPAQSIVRGPSNPRLFREVFGFAYASSLGDPTVGYPS